MSKFSIVPYAGLANRMRAVASGISVAQQFQGSVTNVFWIKEKGCFAEFTDLFEKVKIPNVYVYDICNLNLFKIKSKFTNLFIPTFLRSFYYKKQIIDFNGKTDGDILSLIPNEGAIYFSTCHSMCSHYPLNEIFVPIAAIRSQIDKITSNFSSGKTIGLHIRRTDNKESISNNGIEDFMRKIESELFKNNRTKFYLATDDILVKNELKEKYKDAIITNDATLSRNSLKGIKDAITDLWCLSKTDYLIGSYYSSYSEIAAELGGIHLEILK